MFCLFLPSWHPRPSTKLFGGHQQPLEVTTQLRLANFGWTVRGILGPVESYKQRHGNTTKDMELLHLPIYDWIYKGLSANLKGWKWKLTMPNSVWIAAGVMAFSKLQHSHRDGEQTFMRSKQSKPQPTKLPNVCRLRIFELVHASKLVWFGNTNLRVYRMLSPRRPHSTCQFCMVRYSSFVMLCDITLHNDPQFLIAWIGHCCILLFYDCVF